MKRNKTLLLLATSVLATTTMFSAARAEMTAGAGFGASFWGPETKMKITSYLFDSETTGEKVVSEVANFEQEIPKIEFAISPYVEAHVGYKVADMFEVKVGGGANFSNELKGSIAKDQKVSKVKGISTTDTKKAGTLADVEYNTIDGSTTTYSTSIAPFILVAADLSFNVTDSMSAGIEAGTHIRFQKMKFEQTTKANAVLDKDNSIFSRELVTTVSSEQTEFKISPEIFVGVKVTLEVAEGINLGFGARGHINIETEYEFKDVVAKSTVTSKLTEAGAAKSTTDAAAATAAAGGTAKDAGLRHVKSSSTKDTAGVETWKHEAMKAGDAANTTGTTVDSAKFNPKHKIPGSFQVGGFVSISMAF